MNTTRLHPFESDFPKNNEQEVLLDMLYGSSTLEFSEQTGDAVHYIQNTIPGCDTDLSKAMWR